MNMQRISKLAKKLDANKVLLDIAYKDLSLANKGNPFISKRQAMQNINKVRMQNKQLSKIWNLEFSL